MGQEKGQNQWKSHKFLNFDDMSWYIRGQAFTLHHWIVCDPNTNNKQDTQFRRMWETPLKPTYRLNPVIYRSETQQLKVVK